MFFFGTGALNRGSADDLLVLRVDLTDIRSITQTVRKALDLD